MTPGDGYRRTLDGPLPVKELTLMEMLNCKTEIPGGIRAPRRAIVGRAPGPSPRGYIVAATWSGAAPVGGGAGNWKILPTLGPLRKSAVTDRFAGVLCEYFIMKENEIRSFSWHYILYSVVTSIRCSPERKLIYLENLNVYF